MTPQHVKIGSTYYEIDWTKPSEEGHAGVIDYIPATIQINPDTSASAKQRILLHEVLHGILHQAGQETNERLVVALEYGLLAFLRDNPTTVSWLQATIS